MLFFIQELNKTMHTSTTSQTTTSKTTTQQTTHTTAAISTLSTSNDAATTTTQPGKQNFYFMWKRQKLLFKSSYFNSFILCDIELTTVTTDKSEMTCDCSGTEIKSTGGFAEQYSRYIGQWRYIYDYNGEPLYRCIKDCQNLSDKLVWHSIHQL